MSAIVDLSRTAPPGGLTTEICVVGSGCGGATAAWDLAAAGHEVVVLEEGGDFTGARLTGRDGAMYDQLYMDRGGRSTDDLAISVLQGRVLGGGGVINACDVVPLDDEVLALWRQRFGLTGLTPEALEPHRARALEDLSAGPIPERLVNRANGLLRDGARKAGLRGEVMMHNRVGCAELGTCLIGCPADAKKNPRFVALPAALAAGARVFTRARAVRIHDGGKAVKRVEVRTLDPKGYHETGTFEIRARVVIVAANAVGSAQLLLRSGLGGDHVGRHLTLQPQLPVLGVFDERLRAFQGVPQSYAITEGERFDDEKGHWGFRVEGIMGTPGIVGSLIPLSGIEGKRLMTLYDRIAASLCLAPDAPSGRVVLGDAGRPKILYDHQENHRARIREALAVAARAYFAAGAREVIVPTAPPVFLHGEADLRALERLSLAPATAPFLSAHQQGSVRFAPSPKDGAADPDGQVYGTREVFVFDSSGFPTSAASHTMAPIIALSHYLSAKLAARLA